MTVSAWTRIVPFICALTAADLACAQNYPARPIRLVTSAAGGASDFAARLISQGLSTGLGQQVIVDNRGGGVVPVEIVAKAPADGYTLLYYGSTLWLLPLLQEASYDALRDFMPVSLTVNSPVIVAVHPSVPAKSIKELIALAKARPGALNYGSGGVGSPAHLASEMFKALAGVDMVGVPFSGTGPALIAVVSGEIQVLMSASGGMTPHMNAGRVRALAVSTAQRSASFPNLPTVAEAGVPGYEYGQYSGIFAPARTPAAVINRLNAEIVRVVHRADVKEKFFNTGTDSLGSTPQEGVATIKSDVARFSKVIKGAKIRAQ